MVEDAQTVQLKDEFYRDGFYKMVVALALIVLAILFLLGISVTLWLQKPKPVAFAADKEWRIIPPVPLNQPYLETFDLLQWVSDALPQAFSYDFINYAKKLQHAQLYFTANGWKAFAELLDKYINKDEVQTTKSFTYGSPGGAPIVVNAGLLPTGEYGWWVQMPVKIDYSSYANSSSTTIKLRLLIVRVSTLNNLAGVAIENIQLQS